MDSRNVETIADMSEAQRAFMHPYDSMDEKIDDAIVRREDGEMEHAGVTKTTNKEKKISDSSDVRPNYTSDTHPTGTAGGLQQNAEVSGSLPNKNHRSQAIRSARKINKILGELK
jgi:hypothetical protein